MTRTEAHEAYRELLLAAEGEKKRKEIYKELALKDLFFLLVYVLHRTDIDEPRNGKPIEETPDQVKERDWLYERCREVQLDPDGYLDLWAREHYKGQPLDTPMLSTMGWVKFGDLDVGDSLFGIDGNPCRVVARTEIFNDPECFELVFDDGTRLETSSNHLWDVERRTRKRIPMAYNTSGPKRLYRETVTLSSSEIARHKHTPDNRLAVKVNAPLNYPEADLPIDPYVLGAWLGDGTSSSGQMCGVDKAIFDYVEKAGYTLTENKVRASYNKDFRLVNIAGLSKKLALLKVKNNKHIPEKYLRASTNQRLLLMQGLMDTDGHCDTRGTATFVNKNKSLIDGVYELANTLGLKPHLREINGKHNKKPYQYWQLSFQAYREFPVFRIPRKLNRCKQGSRINPRRYIVSCKPSKTVPMRCIQVNSVDGIYLAGTNLVPTHNSTIITYGLTIQDILNDPDVTFGIFSFTRPIAKAFLRQIKQEFEGNDELKELFPDILWDNPQRQAPKWSEDDGITVKRKSNPKESTIEAWGMIDSMPTSKHFKVLLFDDVVTDTSVSTPDMIRKVTDKWGLALNLGVKGGKQRYIGTRYHLMDTYATMIERKSAIPRIYPATEDGKPEGEPVFMTREILAKKRRDMGPYIFATQMLQNPKQDETQGFKMEWLQYWPALQYKGLNLYLLVDPASKKKKENDYTVFTLWGLGEDENYYVVTWIRDRLNLVERANVLFYLHRTYRPLGIGYEEYGLQADIEHFQDRMNRENYRFAIQPLGGSLHKHDRIRKMIPLFEQKRIYIPEECIRVNYEKVQEDLTKVFVNEEYNIFPYSFHDDMLDCMARIKDEEFITAFPQLHSRQFGLVPPEDQDNYDALRDGLRARG